MSILFFILFILLFFKSLHFLYHFQVKEYRWDRLYSAVKENGWIQFLYNFQLRLPAKSTRNLLATSVIFVEILALFRFINFEELIFVAIFLPAIAFILTSCAVYLTSFLAEAKRRDIIEKAKRKLHQSKTICIGITGTYGKSSVKEFITHILSYQFKVAKTDKNMNTEVGIALSILNNLQSETQYFIAEYGAYKVGEIERACEILKPDISVLTSLGNQHLDLYGSKENLRKAETYILKILDEKSTTYINYDFPESEESVKEVRAKKVFYSLYKGDIYPVEIQTLHTTQKAIIHYKNEKFHIETSLLGTHNILNLLPAIAIAYDLGMKKEIIIEAVNNIKPIEGKLSLHTGIHNALVLNDSYNSVVDGFIALIEVMKTINSEKKIILSKGIIELGVEKRSSYQLILDKLDKTDIMLFTTDKLFKQLDTTGKVMQFNDEKNILKEVKKYATKTSLIAIEGKFTKQFIEKILHI